MTGQIETSVATHAGHSGWLGGSEVQNFSPLCFSFEIIALIHVNPRDFSCHQSCTMEKREGRLIFLRQLKRPSGWSMGGGVKIISLQVWDSWEGTGHRAWEAGRSLGWSSFILSCHRRGNWALRGDLMGPGSHVCLVAELGWEYSDSSSIALAVCDTVLNMRPVSEKEKQQTKWAYMEGWGEKRRIIIPLYQTSPMSDEGSERTDQPSSLTRSRLTVGRRALVVCSKMTLRQ